MPRLAVLAVAIGLAASSAAAWAQTAGAAEPAAPHFLSWPGKTGAGEAPSAAPAPAGPAAPLALSKQFFAGGGEDLAAPPPPLLPRPVPGTQAVTNTASANTASNRARQNEILTADSAADGPAAGVSSPN
jgi:hypothetical protein